jgi:hypothetical protein
LLKSGRRKFAGAVENLGPQGAVKGPPRGQKGSKVAVKKIGNPIKLQLLACSIKQQDEIV